MIQICQGMNSTKLFVYTVYQHHCFVMNLSSSLRQSLLIITCFRSSLYMVLLVRCVYLQILSFIIIVNKSGDLRKNY